MTNKILHMTIKELSIYTIMERLVKKELWIKEASKIISKSERQTKRLKRQYILYWPEWLIHKWRGKISNHKIDENKYIEAVQIIKNKYNDYWPTLCAEKLAENFGITIPISTLRLQMINNWLWKWKIRKKDVRQYIARERKENFWEMIQYDWSYHLWFEWRNWTWYQCLLVAIDDATWKITAKFAKNEWLIETFKFWLEYVKKNWKPQSIYLDKFATYKINYPDATDDKDLTTQFWRACLELWIKLIFANTPQAKWRVERVNLTLQDRLVKELREKWISDIEEANKYLVEVFLPKFNSKFNVQPRWNFDLHTQLRNDEILRLNQIFSEHLLRTVANDYTIKFEKKYYQLYKSENKEYRLKPWQKVCVEKSIEWNINISTCWKYITHKIGFDRPKKSNLLTAPILTNNTFWLQKFKENNITIRDKKEKELIANTMVWINDDPFYIINTI
jgi:hypothetical protein